MRKFTIQFSLLLTLAAVLVACGGEQPTQEDKIEGYSNKEAIENIFERKSVRVFQDREVEQEKIDLILKAAMAAPTAMDNRPWELVVVTDKEVMKGLSEVLPYAPMVAKAPLTVVVCGDTDVSPTTWHLDCSAASQNLLLAVEALDLGAVWTGVYPSEDTQAAVKEFLGLPDNIKALNVIPIGYPEGEFEPKQKWDESKVHLNKW